MAESAVHFANREVSILEVCRRLGMQVPEIREKSVKTYCPFGFMHADEGRSPAFRIYSESNSVYCFAGCGRFEPAGLWAHAHDLEPEEAALRLLNLTGAIAHWEGDEKAWEALTKPPVPDPPSQPDLAAALKLYCERIDSSWEADQFHDYVADRLQQCLELLPRVHTPAEAHQWLDATKRIMRVAIGVIQVQD